MAAHRAGITKILFPAENAQDIKEIPKAVLKEVEMHPVEHLDDVLRHALELPEGRASVFVAEKPEDCDIIPLAVSQGRGRGAGSDEGGDVVAH